LAFEKIQDFDLAMSNEVDETDKNTGNTIKR
jgi:hypothetical protein